MDSAYVAARTRGLLKAKAWLWAMISTGIVLLVMGYAAILFPADFWKIALVLVGWFLFARSMAEKSVTLVTVASSSGEVGKIPTGRRMATQMGMLTFSIGVITEQWHLAIVGLVFSYMTATAMWQNFRARAAVPLRSVVGTITSSSYRNARDGRNQRHA